MQVWHHLHTEDGDVLELRSVPCWAWAVSESADRLCAYTGHILCGEHLPSWLWRIPLGRPQYEAPDEDGERWLTNNLGSCIHDRYSRALFAADRHSRVVHRIPVSVLESGFLVETIRFLCRISAAVSAE